MPFLEGSRYLKLCICKRMIHCLTPEVRLIYKQKKSGLVPRLGTYTLVVLLDLNLVVLENSTYFS